jgi:hypothetical protein
VVIERLLLPPIDFPPSGNGTTGSLLDPAKELGRVEELLKRLEHRRAKDRIEGARSFSVFLRWSPVAGVVVVGVGGVVVESIGWMVTITGIVDCSLEDAPPLPTG